MTQQRFRKTNDFASFKGEQIIRLKAVPGLPLWLERPSFARVEKWAKFGITIDGEKVRLRVRREGRLVLTSVEAVMEFQEALNR
jgi:hypothetical protein